MKWRRAVTAATVAYQENRPVTPEEIADREADERASAARSWLAEAVKHSPMGAWFPNDGSGAGWVPSFFTMTKRDR